MLHFLLCREKLSGMPRIEIEFEFDMVFCFGMRLAQYAFFFFFPFFFFFLFFFPLSDLPQHIARHAESDHSIYIVFVRPFIRPSDQSFRCLHEETLGP